eukprot:m.216514 g.216514  ORF g.216514 m.216514 type:complete len:451 (+) comp28400_c0_seq1:140-1492(+)
MSLHSHTVGEWLEVRDTPTAGRGLVARKAIPSGQVLMVDKPYVAVQLAGTAEEEEWGVHSGPPAIHTCTNCLRAVGPVEAHLQRAAGLTEPIVIPGLTESHNHDSQDDQHSTCRGAAASVVCPGANDGTVSCSDQWCSTDCAQYDKDIHAIVHSPAYAPVRRAALEDNRIMDTAARCLLRALVTAVQNDITITEALSPLRDCVSAPWWDLIDLPEEIPVEEEADFRAAMKEVALRGHAVTETAIRSSPLASRVEPNSLAELLHPDVYCHVLGALHLNAIEIDIEDDPIVGLLSAVAAAPKTHRETITEQLRPALQGLLQHGPSDVAEEDHGSGSQDDGHDSDDETTTASETETETLLTRAIEAAPSLKGTGLFMNLRFANHDCQPNAEVRFRESAVGELVALAPIRAGEQVCIAYFDTEDTTVDERADELRGYQIDPCGCQTCVDERASE